jgi:protein-tyrosine phosphatase
LIDLHCHILPGIDDGAPDLDTALAMARLAVADGVTVTACTPHITPGVYDNKGPDILSAVAALQGQLDKAGIPLTLTSGCDAHLAPDLAEGLREGRVLSLAGSRYFLFEPPHHVAPPRLAETTLELLDQGYVPVVTHPERLTWIEDHYETMKGLAGAGAWMQITAGSLTGRFGKRPRYWAERMLDEGLVQIIATDAHNLRNRVPALAEGREAAAARVGEAEATRMVLTRPQGILDDVDPRALAPPPDRGATGRTGGLLARFFKT